FAVASPRVARPSATLRDLSSMTWEWRGPAAPLRALREDSMFGKTNSSVTQEAVLQVLKTVEDPDLHRNIVELGFVKNLKIDGGAVHFDVELTTPACPVKEQLEQECRDKVAKLPGVTAVQVKMTS